MTQFIPVGNSESGLSLTTKNWQDAKVGCLSYSLENLLHKPGLSFLQELSDLPAYLGWSGSWVLNAASLVANREGMYTLKSPYDGAKLKLSAVELVKLITHLRPKKALLPKKILQDCDSFTALWPDSIHAFFHVGDFVEGMDALYFEEKDIALLPSYTHLERHCIGDLSLQQMQAMSSWAVDWVESDSPSQKAFSATVYTQEGEISLAQRTFDMQFEVIEQHCACPTCEQKLTKAYLHHLFHHTPLLCQRFLVQHNWFWLSQFL